MRDYKYRIQEMGLKNLIGKQKYPPKREDISFISISSMSLNFLYGSIYILYSIPLGS